MRGILQAMRGLGRVCWLFVAAMGSACAASTPTGSATPGPRAPTLPAPIAVVDCPSDAAVCNEMGAAEGCTTGPEDLDGFQDDDACGDPDNDKDQIADTEDKCPNEPETYNGITDEDGCPDKSICSVGPNKIVIPDVVRFDDKGAKIAAGSLPLVDMLAEILLVHPEIELVEVAGHSDERGDDKVNLALTEKRAKVVMDALVAKGVAKSRLRAKGFGEYCPRDPDHTEEAWAANRRVEFRLAKVGGDNAYEELGCAAAKAKGVVSDPVP